MLGTKPSWRWGIRLYRPVDNFSKVKGRNLTIAVQSKQTADTDTVSRQEKNVISFSVLLSLCVNFQTFVYPTESEITHSVYIHCHVRKRYLHITSPISIWKHAFFWCHIAWQCIDEDVANNWNCMVDFLKSSMSNFRYDGAKIDLLNAKCKDD